MTPRWLILHVFMCICILSVCFFDHVYTAKYKLKLISLDTKCKTPDKKLYKNAPLDYNLTARKVNRSTTLISVKFTIFARDGPVFLSLRGYQVQQSASRDLIFNLERMDCKSGFFLTAMKIVDLKVDKDCYALPGNYSADDVNIQDFTPILTKAMIGLGKYSYDIEFVTNKGVCACFTITCDISDFK